MKAEGTTRGGDHPHKGPKVFPSAFQLKVIGLKRGWCLPIARRGGLLQ